jgi:predicted phosphodiesterase
MLKGRFVHVSDIHFGQEKDGTGPEHEDVRQGLLRDCRIMMRDLGPAHGILVTGDIAYSGKRAEYERAGVWLDEMAAVVGCAKSAVHTIPGNHDVDVDKIDYLVEILHEKLRSARTGPQVQSILSNLVPDDAPSSPLLAKLDEYSLFARRYDSDFEHPAKPTSTKEVRFDTGHILRFRGLTSVQVSDLHDDTNKMVLGNRQFIFGPDQNVEYVVMCHHPLDWFKDRRQARKYLAGRARVILAGHEHLANIRKIEEDEFEYLLIDAGATNPPGEEDRQPYTYSWLEFEVHQSSNNVALDVTVHPRVWVKTDFAADTNRLKGVSSRTFTLKCPNYKPIPAARAPATGTIVSTPINVREGEVEPMPEDEKFAKLLYYFWRYLDWQERLKVLVTADVLPSGPDKPLPQALEQSALAKARQEHKLATIWEAVMSRVPMDKREQNPF